MKILEHKAGWIASVLIIAAGLVLYLFGVTGNPEETLVYGRSAIGWMIGRWNWSGADMSYGWVIPFVSLAIIWQKRQAWRDAPKTVDWRGFWVVIIALGLYLAGLRIQQTRLVLCSLILILWGMPFFLLGRTIAGLLVFPCGYLVFCIPMTFVDGLTLPLRLISTTISSSLLNGLGIAVTRVGTAIHINAGAGFSLDVAHPCSGLRYLLAMVALTTAYAYFTQHTLLRRGILCVAAIPLAMAGNIVRIVMIALVGVWFGTDIALGFYHDYSGYVVFAVATFLMLWIGGVLRRLEHSNPPGVKSTVNTTVTCRSGHGLSLLYGASTLIGILIITVGLSTLLQRVSVATVSSADIRPQLPSKAGDWQGRDVFYCQNEQCHRSFESDEIGVRRTCPLCGGVLDSVSLGERTLLPPDTVLVRKIYRNSGGEQVVVTIVLSGAEQKSIHRPQQCLPAQGFAIEESRGMSVSLNDGRNMKLTLLKARPGTIAKGSSAPLVLMAYWFAGGGHETPSHSERLAWMIWDNLAHGIRSRWAYVSLQSSTSGDSTSGERRIAEVARALYPLIHSRAVSQ